MRTALRAFLMIVLCGLLIIGGYYIVSTEVHVFTWQRRVASIKYQEQKILDIRSAQEYSRHLFEAARMMAIENSLLCERDAKMTEFVAALGEENTRLKASVDESITRMESLLEENNELYREIGRLKFQVQCLEKALDFMPTSAEPEDIKEDLLDLFDTVDTAISVLFILL